MLQRFWWTRLGRFLWLDNLPAQIAQNERFTRLLFRRDQFTPSTGRVKPPALMPLHNDRKGRWETSTFRTDGLQPADVWQLGYHFAEDLSSGRRIRARGFGVASIVTTRPLHFDVNGDPYPRHADIIGWPDGTDKPARMMLATEIANRMTLEIDPRPPV